MGLSMGGGGGGAYTEWQFDAHKIHFISDTAVSM